MAWSKRRPPGPRRNKGRTGAAASTAPKTGSGARTMPAPPPKGLSSTLRWGSFASERRSCTTMSMAPARTALPTRLALHQELTRSGKMVKTSALKDRPSQLEQAHGHVHVTTRPGSTDTQSARARRRRCPERAGHWPGWPLPKPPSRGACPMRRRRRRRSARAPTGLRPPRAAPPARTVPLRASARFAGRPRRQSGPATGPLRPLLARQGAGHCRPSSVPPELALERAARG